MNDQNYIQAKTPSFWRATFALSIGAFLVFTNLHMAQPLLPLFSQEFGVSPAVASLSVSLVTFTLSIFLLFFGPISDSIGMLPIFYLLLLLDYCIYLI